MCCVLTALVADATAQQLCFVHIGDTRLYRYRDGILQKLTRDHSFVGIREDAGELSEQEAMAHPHRNQILRELGSAVHRLDDEDFTDYGRDTFLPGDLLLICSDGLTDMVSSQQVTAILATNDAVENKSTALINLANAEGGYDNITVVLLQYPGTTNGQPIDPKEAVPADKPEQNKPIPVRPGSRKKQLGKATLLSASLLLIMIAAAGWYLIAPKKQSASALAEPVPVAHIDTSATDSNHAVKSSHINHPSVQGPVQKDADTMYIVATQHLGDLRRFTDSTGRTLVLIPAKNYNQQSAALSVTGRSAKPGDTVLIRQLRLIGFNNGIDIPFPVSLKTENLVFENTRHPFRYLFKPDPKQSSILFINTGKQ